MNAKIASKIHAHLLGLYINGDGKHHSVCIENVIPQSCSMDVVWLNCISSQFKPF